MYIWYLEAVILGVVAEEIIHHLARLKPHKSYQLYSTTIQYSIPTMHAAGWVDAQAIQSKLRGSMDNHPGRSNFTRLPSISITGWWWTWLLLFQKYIGNTHPNWRTQIFQRGGSTTNQIKLGIDQEKSWSVFLMIFRWMMMNVVFQRLPGQGPSQLDAMLCRTVSVSSMTAPGTTWALVPKPRTGTRIGLFAWVRAMDWQLLVRRREGLFLHGAMNTSKTF